MSKITLFQNDRNWQTIRDQVLDLVDQEHALGTAQNGNLVRQLERRLAKIYNRKHCITVANCTDALVIALRILNLPHASLVAVSNYTFTATAHAVARAGYRVVPVDVTDQYCIDVDKIPADVQAVVNVDLFGNMSDWSKLEALGIPVINDAAQSLESHDGHAWSAQRGVVSCVSFSPSKTISSWGSGGALLTDNDDIAEFACRLRLHGKLTNDAPAIDAGLNSMLSSFEAACIWAGLDHAAQWQARRDSIARHIADTSKYVCGTDFTLPKHTHHKLVFQAEDRAQAVADLKSAGIDAPVHYKLMINDELLYYTPQVFDNSDRLKRQSFTVPNQHTLTDDEVEQIAKALR